jgi:hypothetical protein
LNYRISPVQPGPCGHRLVHDTKDGPKHLGYQRRKSVYYESIKREPKIRGINKCRCDARLQTKTKEFTRLPYTGLVKTGEKKTSHARSLNCDVITPFVSN